MFNVDSTSKLISRYQVNNNRKDIRHYFRQLTKYVDTLSVNQLQYLASSYLDAQIKHHKIHNSYYVEYLVSYISLPTLDTSYETMKRKLDNDDRYQITYYDGDYCLVSTNDNLGNECYYGKTKKVVERYTLDNS